MVGDEELWDRNTVRCWACMLSTQVMDRGLKGNLLDTVVCRGCLHSCLLMFPMMFRRCPSPHCSFKSLSLFYFPPCYFPPDFSA